MADPIKFYTEGLTLTGFWHHIYNWIPVTGEILRCKMTPDGPISACRESEVVGNVPKEVSPIFRKWLKAGGTLKAVVFSDKPRKHMTKGEEIYVNYLFTGEKKPLIINERNTIKKEIEKKMKRKKSLKFYHGDMAECSVRNITDRLVLQGDEGNTGTIEFSVFGMALRGFHVYKEVWVPEIGSRHVCFISEKGAVAVKYKDFEVCGHIPTDTQKLWKRFLKNGGEITAVIAGDPRNHRTKGEEVPATYVFKGSKTNVLSNLSNQIKGDIDKKKKKKKSLRVENGDATTETTQNNVSNNNVLKTRTNDENKASGSKSSSNSSTIYRRKRKLEESQDEDEGETTEIKKKKTKSSSKSDIDKKKKKKKTLRVESGDATTETMQNNISCNNVQNATTNNENKASGSKSSSNSSTIHRLKRKVEESEDEDETTEIKKKKTKSSSEPDITKKKRRKKSLRIESGDATTDTIVLKNNVSNNNVQKTSTNDENKASGSEYLPNSQNNVNNNDVQKTRTNDENKASGSKSSPNSSATYRRKRKLEEIQDEDEGETTEIKKKKTKSSSKSGTNWAMTEFDVELSDKDLGRISQLIGANWQSLGIELGLTHVQISHIVEDGSHEVVDKIRRMLIQWRNSNHPEATLGYLIKAVKNCKKLEIDKQRFIKIMQKICKKDVPLKL